MRKLPYFLLVSLTACTPVLRAASVNAATDCGAGLLALGKPEPSDYVRAAGCWLSRFAGEGLETARAEPTEELGKAVVEAARAVETAQAEPDDAAAQREAERALAKCDELSR